MFTGIIQHMGVVAAVEEVACGRALLIRAGGWAHRPVMGDSIAVGGCCLTVAADPEEPERVLRFDVMGQTLDHTMLGRLQADDRVNLEAPVTPSTLLSGHIVQGHIDGTAAVLSVQSEPDQWRVRFELTSSLRPYVIDKGSIAVDGVSLTVADLGPTWFEVALIPTTLTHTTLGSLAADQLVNLEVDYLAKTVVHWLALQRSTR